MSIIPVPRVAIIVVAAGSGTRLGAGAPKAFVGLAGRTILSHALERVFQTKEPCQVIVVAPAGLEGEAEADIASVAGDRRELARVVTGGATRQESVSRGLGALWGDVDTVLVHDAARALVPAAMIDRVIDAVRATGHAIIPVMPVVDTIKRVDGTVITAAVDRSELAAAQTPQGFRRDVLLTAYQAVGDDFTDDAALMQAAGHTVLTVEGDAMGFKITTPADLERAKAALAPVTPRIGVGTDVHAFGGDGTLWLAGLEWPGEQALSGHSDGDAASHAIVDALLSAAGLGDIGTHFGTARPEFAGAHADVFLAETRRLVEQAGYRIGNVSVQIQAARPKFSPRREEAQRVLSQILGAPVSVAATTTDGLGFVGEGAGVQVFAIAALLPR
ncbi:2-C-methyl-D-erythritol 4-phosphate cytidylyltransferase [Microbacterium sp. NC79]|uniref:2-C-methyl-D-erythritol 4-phosphate cytidylyltransferase n=1 Tax=Microbacterium sp. NC79 TaxID=2851009 RepID=UPI001C2B8EA7|nr:2-C-methyl-D-erythritol 4-phosphate cytidylyltransferase [Microbacterium sp. NC79]